MASRISLAIGGILYAGAREETHEFCPAIFRQPLGALGQMPPCFIHERAKCMHGFRRH